MLGTVLVVCLVIFVVLFSMQLVRDIRNHASFGFHSICEAPSYDFSSSSSSSSSSFSSILEYISSSFSDSDDI